MARVITADIGEKIEVRSTSGETMGFFYFNPADVDLERRCRIVSKRMQEISEAIRKGNSEEVWELNDKVRKQMEFLLGESAADTLFKYNSPLAIMPNGNIYAVYVFDIISKFIAEEVKARAQRSKKMIEKYTKKYTK